jgi:predicted acyltransferase
MCVKNRTQPAMNKIADKRLLSLDLFRGITMLLLLAEGTHLFYFLNGLAPKNTFFDTIAKQLLHADWNGMHFWDLIQPYFTFMVGVAMAFSMKKRQERGETWIKTFKHILLRCAVLFLLGIILQSGYRDRFAWELWNILTHLSISIMITFLIFRFPYIALLIISLSLLILTEIAYRSFSVEGFDQPFIKDHNFGAFVDLMLMGKTHPDGWVSFNCIPTTAHVIWGALTGKVLLNVTDTTSRIRILGLSCMIGLLLGYGLDLAGISPINKKICTSSFVIASGGWSLALFTFLYWFADVRGYRKGIAFFTIVGLNPIFIYVFSQTVGRKFLKDFVYIFTKGFAGLAGFSESIVHFTSYILILGIEWYLCYWLYKKKIYIKI